MFFTSEHEMLQDSVRQFANKELAKGAALRDEKETLEPDLFKKMGELGILGITVPTEFGGAGMDAVAATIVMEELGAVCASTALSYLAHSMLAVHNLCVNGNDAQKKKYLPKLCSGELIGGMGMTEPGAGSDALGMTSKAEKKDNVWILNGTKTYITNGPQGDFFLCYIKTGTDKKDISTFLIEKNFKGFSAGKKISKMGMRGSPTGELIFENCEVPEENLVGKVNDSVHHMVRNLNIERVTIAGISNGIARAAHEYSAKYATERKQFDKPLGSFQMIQKMIADNYAQYVSSRALCFLAARMIDEKKEKEFKIGKMAASAKLVAAQMATEVGLNAIQILGGYGYTKEYPVERYMRDAKLIEIGAGTNEVMRMIIAKDILREFDSSYEW
ncbi:MAG: acyl-CoA dehydrogenase family protein [Oligoflexia bacterium]|nr:acyl-CoA dehydrogenase family protein [Oligoflexia bacterium]